MNDHHYAVIVGIDRYPGIRDLKFARRDADSFHDWLVNPGKGEVPPANVIKISLDGDFQHPVEAQPDRELVDQALKELHTRVRQAVNADPDVWDATRLYVYFSGHGIAPEAQETAVLMANASDEDLGYNIACSLYMKYYRESTDFKEVIFFADCCRSRRADAVSSGPPFKKVARNNGAVVGVMGFATQYRDVAYEPTNGDADQARGYYTQALLEGLEGAAPDPAFGGAVTVSSLQDYVRQRVAKLTEGKPYEQVPEMVADPGAKVILRPAAPRPTRRVRIAFPAGYAGRVTLLSGSLAPVAEHDAAAGVWQLDLEDGLYVVRPADAANGRAFAGKGFVDVLGEDLDVQL